jgi:hypothetical protein
MSHVAGPYRKSLNEPDDLVTAGGAIQKIPLSEAPRKRGVLVSGSTM